MTAAQRRKTRGKIRDVAINCSILTTFTLLAAH